VKETFAQKWLGIFGLAALILLGFFFIKYNFVDSDAASVSNNGFTPKSICGSTGKLPCVPGAIGPGGGTIFYVDSDNRYPTFTYLEAAPAGWSGAPGKDDPTLTWCSDTTHRIQSSTNTWSSRKVGAGKSNTSAMFDACTSGAANTVFNYNKSGRSVVSDWFVPSIGEIALMTDNLQGLADLVAGDYWSSSEFSDSGGWAQSIGHGYQGSATKNTTFYVRPIRAF